MCLPTSPDPLVVSLVSGLVGALIAAVLTVWGMQKIEERKLKIDTLRRLLGSRGDLTSPEFCAAINEVLVVFRSHDDVLDALRKLHQIASTPGKPNVEDALVVLLKAAARACKLSPASLPDTAFLQVFTRGPRKP